MLNDPPTETKQAPGPVRTERRPAADQALVDDLYRRGPTALLGLLGVLGLLAWLLGAHDPERPQIRYVIGALFLVTLLRLGAVLLDRAGRSPARTTTARRRLFAGGALLSALLTATLNVVAYPVLTPAEIAILGAVHTGTASVALTSMGSSPITFGLYTLPAAASMAVLLGLDGRGWGEQPLFAMLCAYYFVMIAIVLQQERIRRRAVELELELADLALRDVLTGLHNRRFLGEYLPKEAAVAESSWQTDERRRPRPTTTLGLLLLDLDHFKRVNDEHGHLAGDEVLRQLGQVLTASVRLCDEVVRWGGEEFAIVLSLPSDERATTSAIAERIRRRVEAHAFAISAAPAQVRRTASIGLTVHPLCTARPHLVPWEVALHLCDLGLYRAKRTGRNRVVAIADGPKLPDASEAEVAALPANDLDRAVETGLVRVIEPAS